MTKKVVHIAGPITGVKNHWKPIEDAETKLEMLGYVLLIPTTPAGTQTEPTTGAQTEPRAVSAHNLLKTMPPYAEGED